MNFRNRLIKAFTFLGGLYFFLQFVLPAQIGGVQLDAYHSKISDGFTVILAMAVGLGLINLLSLHGSRLIFKRRGWVNSLALLLGLFVMLGVTCGDWLRGLGISKDVARFFVLRDFATAIKADADAQKQGVPPAQFRNRKLLEAASALLDESVAGCDAASQTATTCGPRAEELRQSYLRDFHAKAGECRAELDGLRAQLDAGGDGLDRDAAVGLCLNSAGLLWQDMRNLQAKYSIGRRVYDLLYSGFFIALGSAMFSLLGFYIAAAAYRAFRIKSAESALMMTAAILVMLGQIPFGLMIWEGLPEVRLWLLSTPSSAAFRAIKIGAEVAGLVIAFRMWFSIESESFGSK